MKALKSIVTDFGEFEILPKIIVFRASEGAQVGPEQAPEIIEIIQKEIKGSGGWIADKINKYSVDPMIVPNVLKKAPQMKCWSNVTYGRRLADSYAYFKIVLPEHFPINRFTTLKPAIEWTYATIRVHNESEFVYRHL